MFRINADLKKVVAGFAIATVGLAAAANAGAQQYIAEEMLDQQRNRMEQQAAKSENEKKEDKAERKEGDRKKDQSRQVRTSPAYFGIEADTII
ncbi:hypothetical protein SAMN05216203_3271 [Marinobacter daqiaonensis]|uniref:Uncharacterized protein n=1 Tax=Marinobacter daqiaonensis TaxID=650891 RepID=A0A1I6JTF4_9GAMM|nr:hypothetical protein [Marinobacter daqiaonensis]SFR82201.1 hypothetical protein SAMN05216203_3271 [Marinobacter daqiaonensis]